MSTTVIGQPVLPLAMGDRPCPHGYHAFSTCAKCFEARQEHEKVEREREHLINLRKAAAAERTAEAEAERERERHHQVWEQERERRLRLREVREAPKFTETQQRIIADARQAAHEFAGILGGCTFISDDDRLGFEVRIGDRAFLGWYMLSELVLKPESLTIWFAKYAEVVMVERQREIFARVPQTGEVLGRLKWKMATDQACPACGHKLDDPSWCCATCQPHKHTPMRARPADPKVTQAS